LSSEGPVYRVIEKFGLSGWIWMLFQYCQLFVLDW